ncbi:MAG: TatD family deoxyribonuclease [Actinobacteria bacterium]|jgi:TatD DNase family protein|nr:TatD family deoxyribonuclease [Actinomycetota bacterium]NBP53274.1 TatD family deoxyribonuclease [Actinomycetota bacterium]
MWTDTHCHLEDNRMDLGTEAAVRAARDAGVSTMITIGCDADTSRAAIAVAAQHPEVWATVGLHPHEAQHGTDQLLPFIDQPRVIAIGECGLDYYYEHSDRPSQRRAFAEQIALAHQHELTLVVHTRDAWDETLDILDAEGVPTNTVMHCFSGGPEHAKLCLDRGMFLSFSGIVTFKNAADLRDAALMCPEDRLLVETDSPYLAPVPHRGKQNQPAFVAVVGNAIAKLRNVAPEHLAEATSRNARRAFPRMAA